MSPARPLARAALNKFYQTVGVMCGSEPQLAGVSYYRDHLKKSDTLVVLAPGASIASLTDEDFSAIGQSDSIGLSSFIAHDFTPSYWLIETHPPSRGFFDYLAAHPWKLSRTPVLYRGYNSPAKVPHVIRNLLTLRRSREARVLLLKDAYVHDTGRTRPFAATLRASTDDLFYNYIGAVPYCLGLAFKAGYDRVVLCGVDFSHRYFFHEPNAGSEGPETPEFMRVVNLFTGNQLLTDALLNAISEMQALFLAEGRAGLSQCKCDGPLSRLLPGHAFN